VFTRLAITPPKVNRSGRNLQHAEYIVGGWPWHILGEIRAVARAGEPGEISCQVKTQISSISSRSYFTKFEHNTSIGVAMKIFGTQSRKFYGKGSFFIKTKTQKILKIFNVLRFQVAITPQ